jgi:hypothetical protein
VETIIFEKINRKNLSSYAKSDESKKHNSNKDLKDGNKYSILFLYTSKASDGCKDDNKIRY